MSTATQVCEFQKVSDTVRAMGGSEIKNCVPFNSSTTMRNVRVNLGIDEDLQMILEMDPSIIDIGNSANVQDYPLPKPPDKVVGRPPKSGGYVIVFKCRDLLDFSC